MEIHIVRKYMTAGISAAMAMVEYPTPKVCAIKNAPAAMIGGIICPPVDATASTAPANWFLYPMRFIIGIVMLPVPATFATALPEIIPNSALDMTATLAGPPRILPATPFAKSRK